VSTVTIDEAFRERVRSWLESDVVPGWRDSRVPLIPADLAGLVREFGSRRHLFPRPAEAPPDMGEVLPGPAVTYAALIDGSEVEASSPGSAVRPCDLP
jgi:hypothetical protein